MFNLDDLDDAGKDRIPTGYSDETDFVIIMQSVLNKLCTTNYEDKVSRAQLSMSILNIACDVEGELDDDRSVSVILSLLHHLSTIIELAEIDMNEYHKAYQEGTMNQLHENPNMPYYEDKDKE
jgi:hypothetical protein